MNRVLIAFLLMAVGATAFAQGVATQTVEKPKMKFLGAFDGGQPGVGIYKMFDPTDDVVCYILMPESANRRQIEGGWVYEGNSVGSISCLKVKVPVIPIGEKVR
jgi:hypothetical protein